MKTTVRKMKRGNKTITLLGVAHIGTKEYYNQIQKILDSYDTKSVLYEGIITDTGYEFKLMELYKKMSKLLNLENQKEAINYNKEWLKSDLTVSLLESIKGGCIEGDNINDTIELINTHKKTIKLVFKLALKHLLPIMKTFGKGDYTILTSRNNKVMFDCFERLKEVDEVVLFYGEMHFKEIRKNLKKIGFKETGKVIKMKPFN